MIAEITPPWATRTVSSWISRNAILYSKGYLYYLGSSAVKNTLYLPLQIILLFLLFRALLPVLYKMKWLPKQMGKAMAKKVEKEEKRTFDPER